MCSEVFQNEQVVLDSLINYIKNLIFDRVVNVRVTLAKVISDLFKNKSKVFIIYAIRSCMGTGQCRNSKNGKFLKK
jgi:hypothetical protein